MKAFLSGLVLAGLLAAVSIYLYDDLAIDGATGYRPAPHVHLEG